MNEVAEFADKHGQVLLLQRSTVPGPRNNDPGNRYGSWKSCCDPVVRLQSCNAPKHEGSTTFHRNGFVVSAFRPRLRRSCEATEGSPAEWAEIGMDGQTPGAMTFCGQH